MSGVMVWNKPIEAFFMESLLKISFVSILIVIGVDFYFTGLVQERSILVNGSILFAVVTASVLYKYGYFKTSVIWTTLIITLTMFYQSIATNSITTSSMAVIMVIGFSYSVLLKGLLSRWLHAVTIAGMALVFIWMSLNPQRYGKPDASDIIVAGVTYVVLYFIIAYSSRILKNRYDYMVTSLAEKNSELYEKAQEIEAQNEELLQSQDSLYRINIHLESMVEQRTSEVRKQNEQLIKYAYSNAHHVRGPVARLLGLIQLSKMDTNLDYPFLFEKMKEQTVEIDSVIKSINKELQVDRMDMN